MSRRPKGTGSLHQRADGRWVGQIKIGYYPNGRRRYFRCVRSDRAEVEAFLGMAEVAGYARAHAILDIAYGAFGLQRSNQTEEKKMRHYKNRPTSEEVDLLRLICPDVVAMLQEDPRKMAAATNALSNLFERLDAEYRVLYTRQKLQFERELTEAGVSLENEPEPVTA